MLLESAQRAIDVLWLLWETRTCGHTQISGCPCLVFVTRNGTPLTHTTSSVTSARSSAQQAIDALLALKDAADAARAAGHEAIHQKILDEHARYFTDAAGAGVALNAARSGKLEKKPHALATRMLGRQADSLRFARDLRVDFDNYPDAAVMPMFAARGGSAAGQGGALAA